MKLVWWAAAALLPALGCKGEERQDCPAPAACDIRAQRCQRDVTKMMRCLRGGSAASPKIIVTDVAGLKRRVESASEPPDPHSLEILSRGLSLFRLAVPFEGESGGTSAFWDIAAVYVEETKEIVVVDRGEPLDTPEATQILAHELVHAMQDAEYDLRALKERYGTSYDASLALRAVIEGEATLYEELFSLRLQQIPEQEADWAGFFRDWQESSLSDTLERPNPLADAYLYFPYAFGGDFVTRRWLASGREGVQALFASPPRSTREILVHIDLPEVGPEQASLEEHGVPQLQGSYRELGATTLGAWIARVFAAKQGLSDERGGELVARLAGDVFSIHYEPRLDQVVAAWRVRMFGANAAYLWPALDSDKFASAVEDDGREAFLVGSEGKLEGLQLSAWQQREELGDWLVALTSGASAHLRRHQAPSISR